ncbi:MAG: ABC transporter permease [Chthoniobacterales bacterium]|nr:ABC transporter permease [Chthoniobacterales bacterium]
MNSTFRRFLSATIFFALLVLAWELIYRSGRYSPVLVPSPRQVGAYLLASSKDGSLWAATLVTMRRLLTGYLIGVAAGLPLGLITARWNLLNDTVGTLALGLQTLPSVCWVPPIYQRAALTMGSKGFHMWLMVILPASLPFIISGMKQGWAFAWRSLMAAEIFVVILTGFGLGQLLHFGRETQSMDQVLAIMIVIVVIGLLIDKIAFSPVERFLHRRWGTSR